MSTDLEGSPRVAVHQSALDMISDLGGDEGGDIGILIGPEDGAANEIAAVDASPVSEISSARTWTSEAVAEAHEFTHKWHPGKRIVGWYRVVDEQPAWQASYGRTAELFGGDCPVLLLVNRETNEHGVCLPGLLKRKRGTKLLSHTLVSSDGSQRTVDPPKAPEPEVAAPMHPPMLEPEAPSSGAVGAGVLAQHGGLLLEFVDLDAPVADGDLVFSEEGVVEQASAPLATPVPPQPIVMPPMPPHVIPAQTTTRHAPGVSPRVDDEAERRAMLVARARAAQRSRRTRTVAIVAVVGMFCMAIVAVILAQKKKAAEREAERARAASMDAYWGQPMGMPGFPESFGAAPGVMDGPVRTQRLGSSSSGYGDGLGGSRTDLPARPGRDGTMEMDNNSGMGMGGPPGPGASGPLGMVGGIEDSEERPPQAGRGGAVSGGVIDGSGGSGRSSRSR